MDPYLERYWEDVHHRLIQYSCDSLQPRLPEDLWARVEERVFVETDSERIRSIVPDAHVSRIYPLSRPSPDFLKEGGGAVAEPVVFEVQEPLVTEGSISICERRGGRVVTVIEFLSIANKSAGVGQQKYAEKQQQVLRSDASLVEIDLVRAGQRVLALPEHAIPPQLRGDYMACISPGWQRNRRELYPMPVRQRLPLLPIPLRQSESRLSLDLQAVLDRAYLTGRYDRLDYGAELNPALSAEDDAWAKTLLSLRSPGKPA